jgi:hypothetical protein
MIRESSLQIPAGTGKRAFAAAIVDLMTNRNVVSISISNRGKITLTEDIVGEAPKETDERLDALPKTAYVVYQGLNPRQIQMFSEQEFESPTHAGVFLLFQADSRNLVPLLFFSGASCQQMQTYRTFLGVKCDTSQEVPEEGVLVLLVGQEEGEGFHTATHALIAHYRGDQ